MDYPIVITANLKGDDENLMEGVLMCSNPACGCEYPVIDGIPVLVPDVRSYLAANVQAVMMRDSLPMELETIMGDCAGPASVFEATRQHISTYAASHYGVEGVGSIAHLLHRALGLVNQGSDEIACDGVLEGPKPAILDAGCSVGRTSFELADRLGKPVLGIDLNFSMIKLATQVLSDKSVSYPEKVTGLVYHRKKVEVELKNRKLVDFWVADATALPFGDRMFSLVTSVNLLDCMGSPYEHLLESARVLQPSGDLLLASPYDWSPAATPVEAWVGGHSQRSPTGGRSEEVLKSLISDSDQPSPVADLQITGELPRVPWKLRLHDRSRMEYDVHVISCRKN